MAAADGHIVANAKLAEGKALMLKGDVAAACVCLGDALKLFVETYGDLDPRCGDAYFQYGTALLAFSTTQRGVLAEGPGRDEEEDDEEEDEGEEEESGEEDTAQPFTVGAAGAAAQGQAATSAAHANGTGGPAETEDAVEDNEQLAWEVLECARVIFTNQGNEGRAQLARTHHALGEHLMEIGNFDQAAEELEKCLKIQRDISVASRNEAETLFFLALAYQNGKRFEAAATHMRAAIDILQQHKASHERAFNEADFAAQAVRREIEALRAKCDTLEKDAQEHQKEIESLTEIVADTELRLKDIQEEQQIFTSAAEAIKAAMPTAPSQFDQLAASTLTPLVASAAASVGNDAADSPAAPADATRLSSLAARVAGNGPAPALTQGSVSNAGMANGANAPTRIVIDITSRVKRKIKPEATGAGTAEGAEEKEKRPRPADAGPSEAP